VASARYGSSADYAQRCPSVASESEKHRAFVAECIDRVIEDARQRGRGEQAEALASVATWEIDTERVAETARLLAGQLDEAIGSGRFRSDVFADALGVALWSIGVPPGEEPHVRQLAMISDPRIRLIVGLFIPTTASAYA
jgi:hypothetical protein